MTYNHFMVRTQRYLPDEMYRDLRLIAETHQTKVSHLIRQGALKVIKEKTQPMRTEGWRKFAGALKTGPKDLSERINDVYK